MSKKYGEVVTLVRGDVTVNALVVQSVQQQGEEHLTVVYLDPSKSSPLLSGQNVDSAIQRDFAVPLTEGKTFGWKDLQPAEESESSSTTDTDAALQKAGALINEQADKIASLEAELEGAKTKLAATTDGVDKELQGIANATAATAATELADEALGKPEPGDSDSPHAIE